MAFDFHSDKQRYIQIQYENAQNYVIPFIEEKFALNKGTKVLEIGCAEGGVLKAFADKGCICTGIELQESRFEKANETLEKEVKEGKAFLLRKNIYDVDINQDIPHLYDLIVLKDVIEHIPDQEKILNKLREFLIPGGYIFFGFPPWQMPYGGHQQVAKSKILTNLPYFHLLPKTIYRSVLKIFQEPKHKIENLLEIKDTGISIEQFERYARVNKYNIISRTFYLINPIYKYKFGLNAKKQYKMVTKIPYLRNFLTTCMYYLIQKGN